MLYKKNSKNMPNYKQTYATRKLKTGAQLRKRNNMYWDKNLWNWC